MDVELTIATLFGTLSVAINQGALPYPGPYHWRLHFERYGMALDFHGKYPDRHYGNDFVHLIRGEKGRRRHEKRRFYHGLSGYCFVGHGDWLHAICARTGRIGRLVCQHQSFDERLNALVQGMMSRTGAAMDEAH